MKESRDSDKIHMRYQGSEKREVSTVGSVVVFSDRQGGIWLGPFLSPSTGRVELESGRRAGRRMREREMECGRVGFPSLDGIWGGVDWKGM